MRKMKGKIEGVAGLRWHEVNGKDGVGGRRMEGA